MRNLTLNIVDDLFPCNPREEYNNTLVRLCLAHKRYTLCNDANFDPTQFDGWHEVADELRSAGATHVVPVYMYDHSGVALSTAPFSCKWDSGQVGFAYTEDTEVSAEDFERYAQGALDEYDAYLNGEGYGFEITDAEGVVVDSCFGFYDRNHAQEAGEETLAILQEIRSGDRNEDADRYDEFDGFFNEVCEPVRIGSLEYEPARVLKEVDPIAYNEAYLDWLDSQEEDQD